MKYEMPALTDAQRAELIEYCKIRIDESATYSKSAKALSIALIALTAEPTDFLGISDDEAEYNGIRHFSFKPKKIIDLYRATPVPELKLPPKGEWTAEFGKPNQMSESEQVIGWDKCLAEVKRLNGFK